MRIQQLSPSVSNQIAAGEVIERPASVVKELLENALDANATAITVELGFGGLNLIKISDNGQGIHAEDLHLAIAAHATSKISQLTDLYSITTMGFRGEALASIASVSRMSIYSKPADQTHGMLLKVDEQGIHTQMFARNQGTTIEVRDLFGALKSSITLTDITGLGQVSFSAGTLIDRYYVYSLIINNATIDTKLMLISHS